MMPISKLAMATVAAMLIAAPAAASPAGAGPVAETALGAKPQKIRCRTEYEIGSLVKRVRRCGDAATWRKADEASREQTRLIQEDKGRFFQQ